MRPITSKLHGAIDYATGATLLVAPRALRLRDPRASIVLRAAGAGALAYSLLTDYELGVVRRLPLRTHLALDAASGLTVAASPWLLGFRSRGLRHWFPHLLVGAGEVAAAVLTQPVPGGAAGQDAAAPAPTGAAPAPAPASAQPAAPAGAAGEGDSVGTAAAAAVAAGAAAGAAEAATGAADAAATAAGAQGAGAEATGAEGTAPATPATELRAHSHPDPAHAVRPDMSASDELVEEQIRAAEAEAGSIGGRADVIDHDLSPVSDEILTEAERPLAEAGQGYAEGFEQAETDLIESASHGTPSGSPLEDAFSPEVESDLATTSYGEPDEVDITETVEDPGEGPDDPGRGPGVSHDR